MSKKYQHLLSPIKMGNVIFKNRLIASPSGPHFIQGPEPYPTEPLITHYANKAKNGAALVTCREGNVRHSWDPPIESSFGFGRFGYLIVYDIVNPICHHYLSQMSDAVHLYGSKLSMQLGESAGPGYDVSTGFPTRPNMPGITDDTSGKEIPGSQMEEIADDYARYAAALKFCGFDAVYLHMAYRATLLARFLSPLTNKRTDEYGGSLENRGRLPLMVVKKIKEKCGEDFIIEVSISATENGGNTLEDTIEFARMFTGYVDLLQIRSGDIDPNHPTGFNPIRTPTLPLAEAIKKSVSDIKIVAIGGFQDLDLCEDVIASGKVDLIAMARSWISNPDYGRKAYEGRNEDVVPCLRCNGCHRSSEADPISSVCAVNPTWGFEHKIDRMFEPPVDSKKVAIVGGGPAGMEAALIAAGRGHKVSLYEKTDALGGLLKSTDHASFKWPQRDFKNYLIRQIAKSNVKVLLNTEASPEMLEKEEYDVILAAIGSEPIIPDIPGIEGNNVVSAPDVYGNEDALAENVVVIGGGEIGVETGMNLAEKGHKATVIEITNKLAAKAVPIHYYSMFQEAWEKLPNFKTILEARVNNITSNEVTYLDAQGKEHSIEAESVVIAVGMKPKNDLALKFANAAEKFFVIGDCNVAGNIQRAIRSGFGIASML